MKWSLKIGEVGGIGIFIHATFVLIIGFVILTHSVQGSSFTDTVWGVIFTLALFVCVLLHELGHALSAKRFGIKTRDITLLPIGGVARLERMPDQPMQELWVALAGPAVNVVIAVLLFLWLALTNALEPLETLSVAGGSFLERLMVVNLFLVVFNMIPAFPMDGGRVLRAILATRMEYTRATQIAASLGQGIALLFGFVGFFWNPFLIFIALFVWIGAAQEAGMTQMRSALSGIPVANAMITDYRTLTEDSTLADAVKLVIGGSQQDFPVMSGGRVVGVLTRNDLLLALPRKGQNVRVAEIMQREFCTADSSDMLESVFARLREQACHTAPVLHHGSIVGILTMENVGEFIAIQAALGGTKTRFGGGLMGLQTRPA